MVSSADVERLFLQSVLSRGVMSFKLAQVLWEKCVDAVKASDPNLDIPFSKERVAWDGFETRLNNSIDKLGFAFQRLHDEITGREMFALVNCNGDEIAQMATDYNSGEIAFFKAIVEQIMLAPRESYSVSSLAALREISAIKPKSNMSKTQAEMVLCSFVAKGWLLRSIRGRYSLSVRSLLELHKYLKETYPDETLDCDICKEILTRGMRCTTNNCKIRLHWHCFATYRRRFSVCPACNQEWPREVKELTPIGEDAVKDGADGKRQVRTNGDASNEEPDSEDEDVPSQTETQKKKHPQ